MNKPRRIMPSISACAIALLALTFLLPVSGNAEDAKHIPLHLQSTDVIPTGNKWISLPTIRALDGALVNFNVLSMRDKGLLQVEGDTGSPAIQPYVAENKQLLPFQNLKWELIEYWTPVARFSTAGLDISLTYCAPPDARGALIEMTVTNRRTTQASVNFGVKASWGNLSRVTYTPVPLHGERSVLNAPWEQVGEIFNFVTSDTHFAWALYHPGSQGDLLAPPLSTSPSVDVHHAAVLNPGESAEAHFVLGVGVEEYSASQSAYALQDTIDRDGVDAVIQSTASWCRARTRTTGREDLDLMMNRNFLFTALYAWGRALDTEQIAGVTSRSPRYYVSAAYWDRDAMLWSFPGLLDIDRDMARDALEYAFTVQLRNTGTHSRFIDGVTLEDGFELDEAVAPIEAMSQYIAKTSDDAFLKTYQDALLMLYRRLLEHQDGATGLFWTLEDSQDQYYKQQFSTYDNVLVWRTMLDLSALAKRIGDTKAASEMTQRSASLHTAILQHSISSDAPGADGPIFVCATDGKNPIFADVPPGSLLKLPALGFLSEDDPVWNRTYRWLHSPNYKYSYSGQPYGLPGSYRLPFSTSWIVADHLNLKIGREQGLKVALGSSWDGGIISEGVDPTNAIMDSAGRAFATAAGYVAHAICNAYCIDRR